MFNLMVSGGEDSWNEGQFVWPRSRILEYTDERLKREFDALDREALERMATLPTLFMYEQAVGAPARVGLIRKVQQRGGDVRIIFELDEAYDPISEGTLLEMAWDLELDKYEFSRTHWAVKIGSLFEVLAEHGIVPRPAAVSFTEPPSPEPPPVVEVAQAKVFLVHGRDDGAKHAVARFLERHVGLDVIILSERPNKGRTILTKFDEEAQGATFAVVLMTPDDMGRLRPELVPEGEVEPQPRGRPRQNVVFELGVFIGRLGVKRVCALVPPGVERPSDYDGIVYVSYDAHDGWKQKLVTELHAADVPVSPNWWQ